MGELCLLTTESRKQLFCSFQSHHMIYLMFRFQSSKPTKICFQLQAVDTIRNILLRSISGSVVSFVVSDAYFVNGCIKCSVSSSSGHLYLPQASLKPGSVRPTWQRKAGWRWRGLVVGRGSVVGVLQRLGWTRLVLSGVCCVTQSRGWIAPPPHELSTDLLTELIKLIPTVTVSFMRQK